MLNLKRGSEQDVDSLVESMLRLTDYMAQNPNFKRNIFQSFSEEDLNKILKNLNDNNQTLRKATCLFLCSILSNHENALQFMDHMDLPPVYSKITINSMPDAVAKFITPKILKYIESQPAVDALCWYYSPAMAKQQIQNLGYIYQKDVKKLILEFVDPLECLIGINYYETPVNVKSSITIKHPVSPVSKSPTVLKANHKKPSVHEYNNNYITPRTPEPIKTSVSPVHPKKLSTQDYYQKYNMYDILKHRSSGIKVLVRPKKTSQDISKNISTDSKYKSQFKV